MRPRARRMNGRKARVTACSPTTLTSSWRRGGAGETGAGERAAGVGGRDVLGGAPDGDAGVVHQPRQAGAADQLSQLVGRGGDLPGVGHVEEQPFDAPPGAETLTVLPPA